MLQVFHLAHQLQVGGQKGQGRLPLAGHQRLADEDGARTRQIDAAVAGSASVVDDDAVERGALQGDDFGRLLLPVRIEQLALQEVRTDLLQPLRVDVRKTAPEQARGLHQLRGDEPASGLFAQVRSRMGIELDAACAQILALRALLLHLAADVAQQTGQHGLVQLLVARRAGVQRPLVFGDHRQQLAVDVLPLAHAA